MVTGTMYWVILINVVYVLYFCKQENNASTFSSKQIVIVDVRFM
jgi:hypothetical protein